MLRTDRLDLSEIHHLFHLYRLGPLGLLWSESPLSAAAAKGDTAAVEALLEAGARPGAGQYGSYGDMIRVYCMNLCVAECAKIKKDRRRCFGLSQAKKERGGLTGGCTWHGQA